MNNTGIKACVILFCGKYVILLIMEHENNSVLSTVCDYGDCIQPGSYRIHSRFEHAANFASGSNVLTLVSEEAGSGPLNVVIKDTGLLRAEEVIFSPDMVSIGGTDYDIKQVERYSSGIQFECCYPDRIKTNLIIFKEILVSGSHPKSLAFLLDPVRELSFKSAYEIELAARIKEGYRLLKNTDYIAGFRLFKGSGYGLTPSGDDFISGWLAGLHISGVICGNDIAGLSDTIYAECRSDNLVSDTAMLMSKSGHFSRKTKQAVISLIQGDGKTISADTHHMLSTGETSGADFATGLAFSLDDNFL